MQEIIHPGLRHIKVLMVHFTCWLRDIPTVVPSLSNPLSRYRYGVPIPHSSQFWGVLLMRVQECFVGPMELSLILDWNPDCDLGLTVTPILLP
jgi:hypothetical protein